MQACEDIKERLQSLEEVVLEKKAKRQKKRKREADEAGPSGVRDGKAD